MASEHDKEFTGTTGNDAIVDGFENTDGKSLKEKLDQVDKVNGNMGDDVISTGAGNDLAAGDMVGAEWAYIDGKWVYNPDAVVVSDYGADTSFDDTITTGDGNDVLLGNGGNDILNAGAGDDIINAGRGDDTAFGGTGDDLINLEDGNDYAEGGLGDDEMVGYDGADTYIYNRGDGYDRVIDIFNSERNDTLELRGIDPAVSRTNLDGILAEARGRGLPVLLVGMDAPPNYGAASPPPAAPQSALCGTFKKRILSA